MKKVVKIIFIYSGVLFLALVATMVFCAAFLFFYREGNIFGIQYVKEKNVVYARESEDMSLIQNIEIYSSRFDIKLTLNDNVGELIGAMRNDYFGYVKKSKARNGFELEYDEKTKTAVFTSIQPKGWYSSDSYIEIAIPKSIAEKGCNIKVKTNRGDINIVGTDDFVIGKLNIETTKGDVNLSGVSLNGDIEAKIGKGVMFIDDKCSTLDDVDISIKLGSGKINLSKFDAGKFSLGIVDIKAIKSGRIGILKAKELITDGEIEGGGRIEVGKVEFVDFSGLDTDIYINNITGAGAGSSSRIKINGFGKVKINTANCDMEIDAYNGDVNVATVTGSVSVSANQGNIKMTNALKLISAETSYGDIEITFSEAAANYIDSSTTDSKNRAVVATTKNGHIKVVGLQNGNIEATKSGRISLLYDKVVGYNNIVSNMGEIYIIVPNPTNATPTNGLAFNLKVNSKEISDIKVGVVGSLGSVEYNGNGQKEFYNIYNSVTSTSNNLNVFSSNAKIKIRSMDLIKY